MIGQSKIISFDFGRRAAETARLEHWSSIAAQFFTADQIGEINDAFQDLKKRGIVSRIKLTISGTETNTHASVFMSGIAQGRPVALELRKNQNKSYAPDSFQTFVNGKHSGDFHDFTPALLSLAENSKRRADNLIGTAQKARLICL